MAAPERFAKMSDFSLAPRALSAPFRLSRANRTFVGQVQIDAVDPIRKSGRVAFSAFSQGNRTSQKNALSAA